MYQSFNFAQSGPGFGNKACPLSSPISRNYSVKAVTKPRLSDLGQKESLMSAMSEAESHPLSAEGVRSGEYIRWKEQTLANQTSHKVRPDLCWLTEPIKLTQLGGAAKNWSLAKIQWCRYITVISKLIGRCLSLWVVRSNDEKDGNNFRIELDPGVR